jgi:ribonuclease D
MRRPLTVLMQFYAASDVATLIELYPILKDKVSNSERFLKLCSEKVNAHVTIRQKKEEDIKVLEEKLGSCTELSKIVLNMREVRLLK